MATKLIAPMTVLLRAIFSGKTGRRFFLLWVLIDFEGGEECNVM